MPAGVVRDGSSKNAAPQLNALVASLPTAARRRSLSANCAPLKRSRTEDDAAEQRSIEESLGARQTLVSLSTSLSQEETEGQPERPRKDRVAVGAAVNVFCFNTIEAGKSQDIKAETAPSAVPIEVAVARAVRVARAPSASNVMRASAPASNVWRSGDQKKTDQVNETRKKFLQDLTAKMQLCLARIQECQANGDEQNLEKYQELVKTLREQMDKVMTVRQLAAPTAKRARGLM